MLASVLFDLQMPLEFFRNSSKNCQAVAPLTNKVFDYMHEYSILSNRHRLLNKHSIGNTLINVYYLLYFSDLNVPLVISNKPIALGKVRFINKRNPTTIR